MNLTEESQRYDQLVSVCEVTGKFNIIAIGKFLDTDDMNVLINDIISNTEINQSSTAVVLNTPVENEQFELDSE